MTMIGCTLPVSPAGGRARQPAPAAPVRRRHLFIEFRKADHPPVMLTIRFQKTSPGPAIAADRRGKAVGRPRRAFTLVELLVVIAILAILAALLLPVFSRTRAQGKQAACLSNLHQLGFALHTYASDNDGGLVANLPGNPGSNAWVLGNMQIPDQSTNPAGLRQGLLFAYAGHPVVYRCPADPSQTGGQPHVRSYSMNGWMGSRCMGTYSGPTGYRTFLRESELATAGPSKIWVMMDEHELGIDDGWFLVTMDDSDPFGSFPATRHLRGFAWNFADGHAEKNRLRDASTPLEPGAKSVSFKNSDWVRLKQATTVR
jgi:prepilin-type N-terminal cleavage/methylation domain-containing protein